MGKKQKQFSQLSLFNNMNKQQQGFEENDIDLYHIISQEIISRAIYSEKRQKTKTEYKISFKVPLTLFNNTPVFQAPDQSIELQWNHSNCPFSSQDQVQDQNFQRSPLQSILPGHQKNLKTVGAEQNRLTVEKVSDIFPRRFICAYNRFHENIFLKNDLTIVVKNIARCLKLELLKPIVTSFTSQLAKSSLKMFDRDRFNQDAQNQKSKEKKPQNKGKRHESEESLKSLKESKSSSKKIQYSPFELQKSMILNQEIGTKATEIQFLSNFESGNLHLAFKDKFLNNLFYLFLTNDTNTHGFNQWFYFGVKYSGKERKKIRFIIMNISKEFKYDQRMRMLTLVQGKWRRDTPFIVYRNKYSRYSGGNLISLDFEYDFNQSSEKPIFFSFSYPYTFTRAVKLVKEVKNKEYKNLFVSIETLGKTQLTNFIPVIRIEKVQSKKLKELSKKKCVLLVARQHASESPSSFICESLLRNLLSEKKEWEAMLNSYKFVIIPMANPDGVIHGNSRTNIKGYDINRLWQPNKNNFTFMSSETEEMNNYLTELLDDETIEYAIDLHSHSREYGSFVYCCDNSENSRLFRYYFTKNSAECSYEKCKINLTQDKKCTFRGQMYHRLGIKNSYTIETSYYGYVSQGENDSELIPFTLRNFQNIAHSILFTLAEILKNQSSSDQQKQVLKLIDQLDSKAKVSRRTNFLKSKQLFNQSDSDPQNQYLEIIERRQMGQNVNELPVQTNKSANKLSGVPKKHQKHQNLVMHNKSLQMVSKVDHNLQADIEVKKKRKRIYTSIGSSSKGKLDQSPKEGADNSMSKKFLTQAEKQIEFRNTLRRGFNMTQSEIGFYRFRENTIKKVKEQQKKESANCIVYPTSTDLQISSDNIRLLHENLFKGRIKVKSIKEQHYRFLKRMGKGELMGEDSKNIIIKGSFQNKIIQQKSKPKQISDLLSIQKIQQLRLITSSALKR